MCTTVTNQALTKSSYAIRASPHKVKIFHMNNTDITILTCDALQRPMVTALLLTLMTAVLMHRGTKHTTRKVKDGATLSPRRAKQSRIELWNNSFVGLRYSLDTRPVKKPAIALMMPWVR